MRTSTRSVHSRFHKISLTALLMLGLLGCAPVPMATYSSALSGAYNQPAYARYYYPPAPEWHSQFVYPSVRCTAQGNTTICRPI